VTVGGQSAYAAFISPGQVNVQAPSNVGTGTQSLIVTTKAGGAGNSYPVMSSRCSPIIPLMFFPPEPFPVFTSRPAQPNDTIIPYGVGFGAVTPGIPAGRLAGELNTLAAPCHLFIGDAEANLSYDGLAPGYVGLYQLNVVVPNVPSNALTPLTFTLAGTSGGQTLYIAVQ
jgi:uncharacterized protein (TIGR03437 family)